MTILVTNDDGIYASGLWTLVRELAAIARVIVVAPEKQRSGVGTAITLHDPITAKAVTPLVPGVETYAVEGTPSDCAIIALGKLVKSRIDLVISGINHGANLGNDVLVSGTVGAAVQAYLSGVTAFAISVDSADSVYLDGAARLAALLARKLASGSLPSKVFLNINLPDLPLTQVQGVRITRLARQSHSDTVVEEHDGRQAYYKLVRLSINPSKDDRTDVWAIRHGNISITPLHINLINQRSPRLPGELCSDLLQELSGLKAGQQEMPPSSPARLTTPV
ncbi:MAG: 5'/3'-nucleotidase SurE [Chloroflexi bacterium]|nr:5'/3'-nucleotidase SurE [Chloroflexota bacterium]